LLADAVPENGPGMAVLVARGDEVLYRDARGQASIELNVPLSADNVFRIGSVTKQFSAAGLLKLVDQGKVALTDPLSKYLPDYPNGENITIVQLLNHTSGIQSYTNLPGYMDQEIRRDLDTAELIDVFEDKPAEFAPGERWNYNNSGYVLVGAVIEKASGMPWSRWLDESLFKPLQLKHTLDGARRDVVPSMAGGYSSSGDTIQTASPLSMTQPHAAGALLSNVDDLLRWNRALHEGKVLSAENYRRMVTPEGAAAKGAIRYGFGIQAGTIRDRIAYEHGGGIHGFISHLTYLPDSDVTVVVLRNSDGAGGDQVDTVARKLAAFAIGDPYPPIKPVDVPENALKALEGVYRLDKDNVRTLRVREGKLTSQRSGGAVFDLIPISDDTFVFGDSFAKLVIVRDEDGKPTAVRFFQDGEGEGELWPRTDEPVTTRMEIELSREAQARLIGDYASDQLSFKVFFDDTGILRVQVPGQPAFALKAETASKLFITEVDATFEFTPAEGPVKTATLLQGPARIVLERKRD
jgi:CubicO group peptidase (beta-lactamase class C family)